MFADVYKDKLVRWEREVWAKPLTGGALAFALVNHGNDSATVTADLLAVESVFPGGCKPWQVHNAGIVDERTDVARTKMM